MARNSAQIIGLILIIAGAILYLHPQNIFGFQASVSCNNEGVTLSVSPTTLGQNQALTLSGNVYPESGVCSLAGSEVYFWFQDPTTGSYTTANVMSSSLNGNYGQVFIVMPGDYTGNLNIIASLCPHNSQSSCVSAGYHNAQQYVTVQSSFVTLYTLDFTFSPAQGGIVVALTQNGNVIQYATTSSGTGLAQFESVPAGVYSISYQPTGYNNGAFGPFTVSANYAQTINLTPISTTTTTVTVCTTTVTSTTGAIPVTTITQTVSGTCTSGGPVNTSLYPLLPLAMIFSGLLLAGTATVRKRS